MNKRQCWALAVAMTGVLMVGDASAHGRGGGHAHKGGHSRGHIGIYVAPSFGWSFGAYGPIYGPAYRPYGGLYGGPYGGPYGGWYDYPPAVIVPERPPVYIERDDEAAQDEGDSYYCREPEGYYPDVPRCPSGWERIPAQPSR